MITCKLCGTELGKKQVRRDGSLLCPVCGQVYWKTAVEKAARKEEQEEELQRDDFSVLRSRIEARYRRESRNSAEMIRRARIA